MKTWLGILAAGEGRRMGRRPKALLRFQDRYFLEIITDRGRRLDVAGVAVVLGYHRELVEPVARDLVDAVAINESPARGMCSSARELARALPTGAAMLLWPVDLPRVQMKTLETVLELARDHPDRMIIPTHGHGGELGHPPYVPPHAVDGLREVNLESRLDVVLEELSGAPRLVPVDDRWMLRDVDHPEDLEGLESRRQR